MLSSRIRNTGKEMDVTTDTIGCAEWGLFEDIKRPLVIAGPCSAESEEQVMETARQVKAVGVEVFRAGIWKPRTRPGDFEGVGSMGLPWLRRVQEEVGLKVAVEVANAKHVEAALKSGVDGLWIGTRTTVNTFAVQEIADALEGVDIPVWVKNPLNPDVELWMGALERLDMAGVRKIGMVHRGFYAYQPDRYRNQPMWQVPIEMRRRVGESVPMFCDPSHIAGKRKLVPEIAQQAMDLGFDGLMVETHIAPDIALSDAEQQLTPRELDGMLAKLVVRNAEAGDVHCQVLLSQSRVCIDQLDRNIVEMLGLRMQTTDLIGQVKREFDVNVLQPKRWEKVLENVTDEGVKNGLNQKFIEKLYNVVHQESIRRQSELMNAKKEKKSE